LCCTARYSVNSSATYGEPVQHCVHVHVACVHVCMCRRDLFMAVRLALAKLGAGGAAGGEDGDGRGMPVYGTGVTINTGGHQLRGVPLWLLV
jgi:hypothetical protein